MTRQMVSRSKIQEELKAENKDQVLFSNVMVIDLQKFLLTVCELLQLTLQTPIERERERERERETVNVLVEI
jgi:hypothetical protein